MMNVGNKDFFNYLMADGGHIVCAAAKAKHDRSFGHGLKQIFDEIKSLPLRENLTDSQSQQHDKNRLENIIKCLKHLKLYKATVESLISSQTDRKAHEYLTNLALINKTQMLKAVAFIIFNASGPMRDIYKKQLGPAPFTWETFENFGAILIDYSSTPIAVYLDRVPDADIAPFTVEYFKKQPIIEASVDKVINHDLEKMISFFTMIKEHHIDKKPGVSLVKYEFFGIKAITKRLLDVESLSKLLSLTSEIGIVASRIKPPSTQETDPHFFQKTTVEYYKGSDQKYYDLDRMLHLHAGLRRIQMIGELLTGKYFSSEWKELDNSIDWAAFSTLRDGIVHQDEGNNHENVSKLIQDKALFSDLLEGDLIEFHQKLQKIIVKKYASQPAFDENHSDVFVERIVTEEIQRYARINNPTQARAEPIHGRQNQQEAAARRKQEAESRLKGLENIRKAASHFSRSGSSSSAGLGAQKRVELALQHLNNIVYLLEKEAKLKVDTTINPAHILKALMNNSLLDDAISYNIEQFLQHLDRIKDYNDIKDNPLLKNYTGLRHLRNHISHGALLLDKEEFDPVKTPSGFTVRQVKVSIAIRDFLIEFPPTLEKAIQKIDEASTASASSRATLS